MFIKKLIRRENLDYFSVYDSKKILKISRVLPWTGFNWLNIVSNGGLFLTENEVCHKRRRTSTS
jgi:hypothetical protein